MKKFLFIVLSGASLSLSAQKIALNKGQQIIITTTSSQDADIMGMQMKNSANSLASVVVQDSDKDNFITSYKLTKVNVNIDAMGQQNTYDSDKPEDKDSEMGKALGDNINKEVPVLVNKNTGKASVKDKPSPERPEKGAEANPLGGIMESFNAATEDAAVETAFFILQPGKKAGDTWVDSSSREKFKEKKTYTLKSVTDGVATILVNAIIEGSSTVEMQGMEMDLTFSSKSTGNIIVETKTSLVKKRTNNAEITGNINVMGQSVPVNSTAEITIDYK